MSIGVEHDADLMSNTFRSDFVDGSEKRNVAYHMSNIVSGKFPRKRAGRLPTPARKHASLEEA